MGIRDIWRIIRQNGGIWGSIKAIYYRDVLKDGKLVGTDDYGNRYYENNNYFIPRNRWVEYADHVALEYDGSQVPAEWYGWLHHRTDLLPSQETYRPKYPWMDPHTENMSGTNEQFVPYTTTMPKITPWQPPRGRGGSWSTSDSSKSPGALEGGRKRSDISKDCKDVREDATPDKCEGEKKTPPECEVKEVKKECDKEEEKERPKCEKPGPVFH